MEVLVGLVLVSLLAAGAATLATATDSGRRADDARVQLDRALRGALATLTDDVRSAGERLPGDVPAVELVDGVDGAPDVLVLRRGRLDAVLPVCAPLDDADDGVRISADAPGGAPGCAPQPDVDGSGWPDNVDPWRDLRGGGTLRAFVWDPAAREGEWFVHDRDGASPALLARAPGSWSLRCDAGRRCRIYALAERRYALVDGLLTRARDGLAGAAVPVAGGVTDFQVRLELDDGRTLDAFAPGRDWTRIRGVELTLRAEAGVGSGVLARTARTRALPRTALR